MKTVLLWLLLVFVAFIWGEVVTIRQSIERSDDFEYVQTLIRMTQQTGDTVYLQQADSVLQEIKNNPI